MIGVVVVDDHPVNRRVIRLFLEPFECDLVEAEAGDHALGGAKVGLQGRQQVQARAQPHEQAQGSQRQRQHAQQDPRLGTQ